jgi:hypothetical protein
MKDAYTEIERKIVVAYLDALQSVMMKRAGSYGSGYFVNARTAISDGAAGPATFEDAKKQALKVYPDLFSDEDARGESVIRTFERVGKGATDDEIRATGKLLHQQYGGEDAKKFQKEFLAWRSQPRFITKPLGGTLSVVWDNEAYKEASGPIAHQDAKQMALAFNDDATKLKA